jgi:hypothetical protein
MKEITKIEGKMMGGKGKKERRWLLKRKDISKI